MAAGCVWLERLGAGYAARLARVATAAAVLLYALFLLPFALPILRPDLMARYSVASGLTAAVQTNYGTTLPLPQDFADMTGWHEMALAVRHVYDSLPAEKRDVAVLAGNNYGEAGALDFYGPKLGLPYVVSDHGSYWFFGPGARPGTVLITLGFSREDLAPQCGSITHAARVTNTWGVDEEQDVSVYVCEQPRMTLQQIWPSLAGRN
jgi:hypothetical protein